MRGKAKSKRGLSGVGKQPDALLTYKSLPLFDPSRRSTKPGAAYGKKYIGDFLNLPSLDTVPVRSGAACGNALHSLNYHKAFARDLVQQAPWKYQPGERFRTLAGRECNAIHQVIDAEEQERHRQILVRKEAQRQARMRRAEELERECMAYCEAEMQAIVAVEQVEAAKAERTRIRRLPVLRRLEEVKEMQNEREREKHRLEQEEIAKKKAAADAIAEAEAKEARFTAQIKKLEEESKFTGNSKVAVKQVEKKAASSAAAT